MKKQGQLTGKCDKCGEVAPLHGTENYGEWLCENCDD
jgi:formylmethanofuran dehydrogenase subunit E